MHLACCKKSWRPLVLTHCFIYRSMGLRFLHFMSVSEFQESTFFRSQCRCARGFNMILPFSLSFPRCDVALRLIFAVRASPPRLHPSAPPKIPSRGAPLGRLAAVDCGTIPQGLVLGLAHTDTQSVQLGLAYTDTQISC